MEFWPCGFKIEHTKFSFASCGSSELGFWNSNHGILKSKIRSSASPFVTEVWLVFWNSDHVVLKLSILSLALVYLAAVQLESKSDPGCILFMLDIHQSTYISDILWYDFRKGSFFGHTNTKTTHTHRWTDRRGSWNSYLDKENYFFWGDSSFSINDTSIKFPKNGWVREPISDK